MLLHPAMLARAGVRLTLVSVLYETACGFQPWAIRKPADASLGRYGSLRVPALGDTEACGFKPGALREPAGFSSPHSRRRWSSAPRIRRAGGVQLPAFAAPVGFSSPHSRSRWSSAPPGGRPLGSTVFQNFAKSANGIRELSRLSVPFVSTGIQYFPWGLMWGTGACSPSRGPNHSPHRACTGPIRRCICGSRQAEQNTGFNASLLTVAATIQGWAASRSLRSRLRGGGLSTTGGRSQRAAIRSRRNPGLTYPPSDRRRHRRVKRCARDGATGSTLRTRPPAWTGTRSRSWESSA